MTSQFRKWQGEKQEPNNPLYVVLFASRNKDNTEVYNFVERRQAFLYHLPATSEITQGLKRRFSRFINDGRPGEMSRMYVSINARNPDRIKKELMHRLVEDNLGGGQTPLTHMDSLMASIGATKECAAEKKWLLDCDTNDEMFVSELQSFLQNNLKLVVQKYKTPNGYALITSRGFDIRALEGKGFSKHMNEMPECFPKYEQYTQQVTIKKDDMLCVCWDKQNMD